MHLSTVETDDGSTPPQVSPIVLSSTIQDSVEDDDDDDDDDDGSNDIEGTWQKFNCIT